MAEKFDTDQFSGLHAQCWGYETEKEWESVWQKTHGESQADFYVDVMNFIRGESHNIMVDTNGEIKADIVKGLIAMNPVLASPENKVILMEKMNKIYHEDHTMKFNLTEQDIATLLTMTPHDDIKPY